MKQQNTLNKRVFLCILIFSIWTILVCCSLISINLNRETYINFGKKLATREKLIYPTRGKIFDKNKILLAWSEIHFDLYLSNIPVDFDFSELIAKINVIIPNRLSAISEFYDHQLLISNIPITALEALDKLAVNNPIKIKMRRERIKANIAQTVDFIGDVKNNCGISGIEKKYDKILRGKAGKISVIVDRNDNWVEKSIQFKVQAQKGKDVILTQSLEDIIIDINLAKDREKNK